MVFQNRYMGIETPPHPLHGKNHLKFPFWLFEPLPKSNSSPFIVFRVRFCVQDEGFITFDYGAEGDEEDMVDKDKEEEMEWLAEALQFLFQTS